MNQECNGYEISSIFRVLCFGRVKTRRVSHTISAFLSVYVIDDRSNGFNDLHKSVSGAVSPFRDMVFGSGLLLHRGKSR